MSSALQPANTPEEKLDDAVPLQEYDITEDAEHLVDAGSLVDSLDDRWQKVDLEARVGRPWYSVVLPLQQAMKSASCTRQTLQSIARKLYFISKHLYLAAWQCFVSISILNNRFFIDIRLDYATDCAVKSLRDHLTRVSVSPILFMCILQWTFVAMCTRTIE